MALFGAAAGYLFSTASRASVRLARAAGVPVVPVGIVGTHALWPRGQPFPRRGPVSVCFGEAWKPDPALTPAAIADELAARCCAAAATAALASTGLP
jgi:1-acyl-sn-glycerol-3-phosphate acyltransferase